MKYFNHIEHTEILIIVQQLSQQAYQLLGINCKPLWIMGFLFLQSIH